MFASQSKLGLSWNQIRSKTIPLTIGVLRNLVLDKIALFA